MASATTTTREQPSSTPATTTTTTTAVVAAGHRSKSISGGNNNSPREAAVDSVGGGGKGNDNNGYVHHAFLPTVSSSPLDFNSWYPGVLLSALGLPKSASALSGHQRRLLQVAAVALASLLLYQVLACDLGLLFHRLCAFVVPLFALACAYCWLTLSFRRTWSITSIYLLFCACYCGEVICQCWQWDPTATTTTAVSLDLAGVVDLQPTPANPGDTGGAGDDDDTGGPEPPPGARHASFWGTTLLWCLFHQFPLLLTLAVAAYFSTLSSAWHDVFVVLFVFVTRALACSQLADWPVSFRPFIAYSCGIGGVLAAKHMEAALKRSSTSANSSLIMNPDGKIPVVRRRRTSSSANIHSYGHKARRTSLPALSMQKNHMQGNQTGMSALDIALLSEAHGLVTDMLADTTLPLHVVSALRALSNLLAPPNNTITHVQRPRISGISALTAELNSGSDNEEIPVMGEKLSALPKKFRRNLPQSLLRRMSTSTWTTTTSATGMPTLEPEPCRKRSTSFRNAPDLIMSSSPTSQLLSVDCNSGRISVSKYRSYSTTSLIQTPSHNRRLVRERKTVCSLHPLTASDINRLHCLSDAAIAAAADRDHGGAGGISDAVSSGGEDDDDHRSFSGGNISDGGGGGGFGIGVILGGSSGETSPSAPCLSPSAYSQSIPAIRRVDSGDSRVVYVGDGTRYDLERLHEDPLLDRINEWDYPIFDLQALSPDCVLSQMCYRVFLEVGLFETFRIPIQEFLAYFHALESGYRDKPYHNRMHAADVLHAVYYLTSQPIPGFTQLPLEVESPPPVQKSETGSSSPGLVQRQSFNAEDTYGIMGANLPALELMALYTAAAMHDYDHPGRTNAFLVTTYAPEAVLYNDRSVLENHHAAAAWSLFLSMPDYNFLCHLDKAEFKRFRFLVIEAILATDLKRHFEILAEFNAKANDDDAPGIDWNSETDRLLAMEMCIKLADINGPCKRHDIHVQWTARIADEFYEQGDEEASLGLQISPFMDRCNPQLAKLQESFINHLVAPLCTSYGAAGMLPGQWLEGSESDDEATTDEKGDADVTVERQSRQGKVLKDNSGRITCLQTQHLKENHDYWVLIIKEEEENSKL